MTILIDLMMENPNLKSLLSEMLSTCIRVLQTNRTNKLFYTNLALYVPVKAFSLSKLWL